jgi:hypothetical protein
VYVLIGIIVPDGTQHWPVRVRPRRRRRISVHLLLDSCGNRGMKAHGLSIGGPAHGSYLDVLTIILRQVEK